MDTILAPLMDDLRLCLCSALASTAGGSVDCACLLTPGVRAPADWCTCSGGGGCGQAWVRLDRMYPSSAKFPSPDITPLKCATVLAAVLEVGVYRCQPAPSANGAPPTPAAQTQAALTQIDDSLAMAKAIQCCSSVIRRPYVLGNYSPRSSGACGGGVWTVTVQLIRR